MWHHEVRCKCPRLGLSVIVLPFKHSDSLLLLSNMSYSTSLSRSYNSNNVCIFHLWWRWGQYYTYWRWKKKYFGSYSLHSILHAHKYRALISTLVISPGRKYPAFRHTFSSPFGGFQDTLTNFYKLRENYVAQVWHRSSKCLWLLLSVKQENLL